jgi:hypothetical protein
MIQNVWVVLAALNCVFPACVALILAFPAFVPTFTVFPVIEISPEATENVTAKFELVEAETVKLVPIFLSVIEPKLMVWSVLVVVVLLWVAVLIWLRA